MSDKIVSIINRMHRYPFGLRSNVEASKKELEKLQKEKSKLKEEEEKHSEEVKLLKEQGGSFAFLMSDQNQCVGAHHLASLSGQIGEPILLGFFVVLQATLSTFAGEDLHNMIALDFLEQGSHSFKNRGFPSPTSMAVDGGQNVAVVDDSKGSYLSFQTNNMGFDASSRIRNIIKSSFDSRSWRPLEKTRPLSLILGLKAPYLQCNNGIFSPILSPLLLSSSSIKLIFFPEKLQVVSIVIGHDLDVTPPDKLITGKSNPFFLQW
uniref:Uncharacterized protein n=1 Tax=Cannabis sativa TaxID=3483 RepID=A0A803Q8N3_CANSA